MGAIIKTYRHGSRSFAVLDTFAADQSMILGEKHVTRNFPIPPVAKLKQNPSETACDLSSLFQTLRWCPAFHLTWPRDQAFSSDVVMHSLVSVNGSEFPLSRRLTGIRPAVLFRGLYAMASVRLLVHANTITRSLGFATTCAEFPQRYASITEIVRGGFKISWVGVASFFCG